MFVLHLALQGCLRTGAVEYGLTADTGGHIRYLLELVDHAGRRPELSRQQVVTRAFDDPGLGPTYRAGTERVDARTEIVRLRGASDDYLPKEALWREHEALAGALVSHIERLGRRPDLIHAHYADAGEVARLACARLGLPFVFTAHSLGRVKARACGDALPARAEPEGEGDLARRIRTEERVIGAARRIIASSRDEAELQYGLYASADPAKITVCPPGCDLGLITGELEAGARVLADAERFLADPSKPPLLALARPVRKKNLTGLVRAYGESAPLRQAANLVIYAGTRCDLREQEAENREVLEELLYLQDRYDLYGQLALPKSHGPEDVPAFYAWAARLRGVFMNPALNEPFGLTLLEAASAGLPVVATASGGPVDIVGRLQNGLLVDPHDEAQVAAGALRLLSDPGLWRSCSESGKGACSYYDWSRHAQDYVAVCRQAAKPPAPPIVKREPRPFLILSDIDNTLTGDRTALGQLSRWLSADDEHTFGIATGRSLHDALAVLSEWDAPAPDVLVTSVGAEIYYAREPWGELVRDEAWSAHIAPGWAPDAVREAVLAFGGATLQPEIEQRPFKLGFLAEDTNGYVERLRRHLAALRHQVTVIFSHGEYLDVLPARASKGHALDYLRASLRVPFRHTIAAGDSGNDAELLAHAGYPILVANHTSELDQMRRSARVFASDLPYAAGLLDGLEAFHRHRDPLQPVSRVRATLAARKDDEHGDARPRLPSRR